MNDPFEILAHEATVKAPLFLCQQCFIAKVYYLPATSARASRCSGASSVLGRSVFGGAGQPDAPTSSALKTLDVLVLMVNLKSAILKDTIPFVLSLDGEKAD